MQTRYFLNIWFSIVKSSTTFVRDHFKLDGMFCQLIHSILIETNVKLFIQFLWMLPAVDFEFWFLDISTTSGKFSSIRSRCDQPLETLSMSTWLPKFQIWSLRAGWEQAKKIQIQIADSRFRFTMQIADSDFRLQIQIPESDSQCRLQIQISDSDSRFRFTM